MHALSIDVYPVYAVVGQDRFLRNETLDAVLDVLAGEMDSMGPTRFDGPHVKLAEVLDEVRTQSLLGDRRVVIVDEADAFITAHRAALERYCTSPTESGSLILLCKTLPKTTRLHKIIERTGAILSVASPKGRAVVGWLVNRAQGVYGQRLPQHSAQMLYDHLGDAFGALDAELAKLATYVGDRDEITPADVDALTGHHREEKVFAVTDAMSSKDVAGALRQWEQVVATDPAAPGRAIAGLAWGVRRLLEAKRDWEAGASIRELARRMYIDPRVLQQRLERVTTERLEMQQQDLLAADLALKTGTSTIDLAVAKFIVKHSAAATN